MVLAIGLVVDDAIVVVENVERQLEAGLPPLAAARKAMAEVTGPIIATTAVLMAVFVPVAFIPGVAGPALQPVRADGRDFGRHFRLQLADAEPGAERRVPAPSARGHFAPFRWFNAGFEALSHGYSRSVRAFIRFGWAMLGVFVRWSVATFATVAAAPVDLPAGRGPGLFLRRDPAARRRLAGAHRRGRQKGARHPAGDARRRHRRLHQRAQLPDQRRAVQFGGRIRDSETVGRARPGTERLEHRRRRCGRSCSAFPRPSR